MVELSNKLGVVVKVVTVDSVVKESMAVGLIGLHGVIVAKAVKLVSKNVYGLAQIQFLATVELLALGHLDNLKYATRTIAQ
ncbi:hypothetical protein ABFA07_010854 [Porites harrisoni]